MYKLANKKKTWVYIDIPGIVKNCYRIYPSGRIYSENIGKYMQTNINNRGYECIHLKTEDGGRKQEFIHRLLAYAFIERTEEDEKFERDLVHFIDFDKTNFSLDNLQFVNTGELWMKIYIHNYIDKFKTLSNYTNFIRRLYKRGYDIDTIINVLGLPTTRYTKSCISKMVTRKDKNK